MSCICVEHFLGTRIKYFRIEFQSESENEKNQQNLAEIPLRRCERKLVGCLSMKEKTLRVGT